MLNIKYILPLICLSMIFALLNYDNASSQELKQSTTLSATFYVATNGNDKWSGTLPSPNALGNDGPFATLQQARDTTRKLRNNGYLAAFTVLVRGGVYQLNETFILDPEDSGTESYPLVFKAFDNEHPILNGTRRISDFEQYKGNIHKASLTGIDIESYPVRQLFANGKRQTIARYPNSEPSNPIGGGFLYVEGATKEGSRREFKYKEVSLHALTNLQDAEVFIYPGSNWSNEILRVLRIDRNDSTVTLSQSAYYEIQSGNRFFFQNILEEIDSPGEWYVDRQGKVLYYWPENDVALGTVTIPVLNSILEIKGKKYGNNYYGAPSYIRFEGFTLEGCAGSAIVVTGAKSTVIAGNTIYNAGKHGIEIQDGFDNAAVGNDIYSVGGIGIKISGGDRKTLSPANNRAVNNYVHDTGYFIKGESGIYCGGVGNVISHNLVHSTPRVGIWLEGNDHLFEYNHIHHVNQETEDSGIIYSTQLDWTKRGNIIQFNYLHDSGGYGLNISTGIWQTPFRTYGIYLDTWTSGTKIYGNIITSTDYGGVFIHGGRDNIVENNVIMEGGHLGQMVYSGYPLTHPDGKKFIPSMFAKIKNMGHTKYPLLSTIKDVQTGAMMSGNSFTRNIIYYTGQNSVLYGIYNDFDFATTVSDYNIIYHNGLPLLAPFLKVPPDKQWITWLGKGLDKNSLIADPMFSDVARGDYTLSPASPALKMGFKPIPFEKIGPYKDPLRASWPIKE